MRIQPGFKFVDEAALSQACIAFDNDDGHTAMHQALLERGLYELEFRLAPHHARGHTLDSPSAHTKGTRPYALDEIGLQRLGLAFHGYRRLLLYIKDAPHKLIRVVRNENVTPIRRVDQP